jgi:hypothetical protein
VLALVERFPSLTRIFCGHNHSLTMTQYRQAIISTIPGTVHQVPFMKIPVGDRPLRRRA